MCLTNTIQIMLNLSANIERGIDRDEHYIVTPNVQRVANEIVRQYVSGIHSFCIVGTYGTGKSSFLLHFEDNLKAGGQGELVKNPQLLNGCSQFDFLNIVGDYTSIDKLLDEKLQPILGDTGESMDPLGKLRAYLKILKGQRKTLVIVIDEFGKLLEYAATKNPERELYYMQKLAELVNSPHYEVLLLTTLHQNFGAYSQKLNDVQRDEWTKVKGRFQEIVFAEPIAQLIYLAAESIFQSEVPLGTNFSRFKHVYNLACKTKFITSDIEEKTALKLYPLDAFAAFVITLAIQRYGQNERSLFSFLLSKGEYSLRKVAGEKPTIYSLVNAYDYIISNFHSYLVESNVEIMNWSMIRMAIERVESHDWVDSSQMVDAVKLVKTIGLLNIFGHAGFTMTPEQIVSYAANALDMTATEDTLKELLRLKIIRYAQYKQRFVLFEGTDVNLEYEFQQAGAIVPRPVNYVDDLRVHFNHRLSPVKAYYYQKGTPRYFEYFVTDEPKDIVPNGDLDGYVQLVFNTNNQGLKQTAEFSEKCEHAIIFVYFNHSDRIVEHLYNISKYQYILDEVLADKSDRVALNEIARQKAYEQTMLNKSIRDDLFNYTQNVTWLYKGQERAVSSLRDFNRLLSEVCNDVYPLTPVMNNELFNRHKLSGAISSARVKYLQALTERSHMHDFGFEAGKFPPEKAIYYSLLKNTGLHVDGKFADVPSFAGINPLWEVSERFLQSTKDKPRKISDFIKQLSEQPYKLKDGFIDFWLPTYLFIKRQDFALYGKGGRYIPNVNMEFFELLKKHPADYQIKAFATDGVKLEFFNQYRKFIHAERADEIKGEKFIETIKPFFFFYNHLNEYAKHTAKFDHVETLKFREVLSNARDPEKAFFESLPESLGFEFGMFRQESFIEDYCNKIQCAVRELRGCYNALIDRLETRLVEDLGLDNADYSVYILEIRKRLGHIETSLLTDKQRDFYNHAMTEFDNRTEWFQSVCYVAMDQPLERLRDNQENELAEKLVYLFRECEKYIVASNDLNFHISETDARKAQLVESKIEQILSGNNHLDVHILINVLKRKLQ